MKGVPKMLTAILVYISVQIGNGSSQLIAPSVTDMPGHTCRIEVEAHSTNQASSVRVEHCDLSGKKD